MNQKFITPQEVAEMLRLPKTTVYLLIHRGELPSVRFGRRIRVPVDALQRYIDDRLRQFNLKPTSGSTKG